MMRFFGGLLAIFILCFAVSAEAKVCGGEVDVIKVEVEVVGCMVEVDVVEVGEFDEFSEFLHGLQCLFAFFLRCSAFWDFSLGLG